MVEEQVLTPYLERLSERRFVVALRHQLARIRNKLTELHLPVTIQVRLSDDRGQLLLGRVVTERPAKTCETHER